MRPEKDGLGLGGGLEVTAVTRGRGQEGLNARYSNEYRDGLQMKAVLITSQGILQFHRLSIGPWIFHICEECCLVMER